MEKVITQQHKDRLVDEELIVEWDEYSLDNLSAKYKDIESLKDSKQKLNALLKLYLRLQMNFIEDIFNFEKNE